LALAAALAVATMATVGCAQYRPTSSGYLTDYSRLERAPFHINAGIGEQRAEVLHATSDEYREFDSIYVEPPAWLVDPKSRAGRNPRWRVELLARLESELRDQLGEIKPVVDVPGPRTATVRSAITRVQLSWPLVNLGLTATLFSPVPIGPVFFGGAAMEAEVIGPGPERRQIAAVSTTSAGGLIDVYGYYVKSGHARKAMNRMVGELKDAIID
jgi:hypothetical protein